MNQHFTPPRPVYTTVIDDDAATNLQDEIHSAQMMAEITATLVCEAFETPRQLGDYLVTRFRSDMIVFAASDTARRLREIDAAFEKLTAGQP